MVKRIWAVFFICIGLTMVSGCWDYQDLDELSIPIVGIYDLAKPSDKNEGKMKIAGVFPVFFPQTKESYQIPYQIAQTIGETREKRATSAPEKFLQGMLQVGVYGENLAREGLRNPMDILFRDPKVKNTIYMAVMEGGTEALTRLQLEAYPNPGVFLVHLLRDAQNKGFLPTITIYSFGLNEKTTGKNPVVPLLKMKDNSTIEISGTGIFKKDKLIAKIGLNDTRSLVMLRGLKGEGRIPFTVIKNGEKIDEGTVIVKRTRKVRVIRKGGNFTFIISIKLEGDLLEHYSQKLFIGTKNTMKLKEIEQAVKREIEKDCQKFIQKMQQDFKVDCIDITKYALAKWRNELINKVDKEFIEKVKIVVKVEVKIEEFGDLT